MLSSSISSSCPCRMIGPLTRNKGSMREATVPSGMCRGLSTVNFSSLRESSRNPVANSGWPSWPVSVAR